MLLLKQYNTELDVYLSLVEIMALSGREIGDFSELKQIQGQETEKAMK